jgi:hypothetical protein
MRIMGGFTNKTCRSSRIFEINRLIPKNSSKVNLKQDNGTRFGKIQKGIFGLGIEIQELGDMTARL